MADPFDTRLYRNKPSTVFADAMAQFRTAEPEDPTRTVPWTRISPRSRSSRSR
jgi:hypothetical protein